MSKLESTERTNAIFLLIVLVAGTFTAISPFMTGAQAFQMENNYNNYESDYGTNSYDDKQSYGEDNGYHKSKDSSSYVKCNNINANVNGFNGVEIGRLPTDLNGLATDETQASDEGEVGANTLENGGGSDGGGRPSGSDSNIKFVCIYNNIPPEPVKDPILTVKKEMVICKTPHPSGEDVIDCIDDSTKTILGPDSTIMDTMG